MTKVVWGSWILWVSLMVLLSALFLSFSEKQSTNTETTPEPFLGPIFYGEEAVWNVFDHDLPGGDNNDYLIHYDGVLYTPPIASGYGYDEHLGIDYSLVYEPVLADGDGVVGYAGRNNPANHRSGYGLYVTINHGDYRTIYGHLSALTVQG